MSKKSVQVISFQSLSANSGTGMARLGHMLSSQLDKKGILSNFIVHSKGKFDTSFKSIPVSWLSRYYLFFLNKLKNIFSIPDYKFRLLQEILFDWFCKKRINKNTSVIFTTNTFLHHTFKKAKKLGIIVVLLPGTPEENYINRLVTEENKRMNITAIDAYTYKRRLNYFNKSIQYVDIVVGSLPTVYTSYVNSNFKGKVVKILGHMTPDLKPITIDNNKKKSGTYTIGYLAYTVVLKGLHYLLEAWQEITESNNDYKMRLVIGGNLDTNVEKYVNQHFPNLKNVEMVGHVSDIPSFMQNLDLFIVPSLVDGGPMTAIEASHYSIPVIITDNCGAGELLNRNKGCWIIPIRDKNAIKEKILWSYQNIEESKLMGNIAHQNLENYNMENFISELVDFIEHKV